MAKNANADQPAKKSKGVGGLLLVVFLLLEILLGVLAYLAYGYNYGGFADRVASTIAASNPAYLKKYAELDAAMAGLQNDKQALVASQTQLASDKKKLEQNQKKVDAREKAVTERENAILAKEQTAEEKQAALNQLAKTIAAMTASNAAKLLTQMPDIQTAASLLKAMDVKKSATILDNMDAAKAAELSAAMLH